MTRVDIERKFGVESAEAIILRKLNDEQLREAEVKKHPDLPDSIDMMQFLIFDSEEEIEQEEEVMEMLYKLAEGDDSSDSIISNDSSSADKKKKKKDKKPKKAMLHACNRIAIWYYKPHISTLNLASLTNLLETYVVRC